MCTLQPAVTFSFFVMLEWSAHVYTTVSGKSLDATKTLS